MFNSREDTPSSGARSSGKAGDENRARLQSQDNFFKFAKVEPSQGDISSGSSIDEVDVGQAGSFRSSSSFEEDDEDAMSRETVQKPKTEVYGYRRASHLFLLISVVSAVLVLIFEVYMYAVINIHKENIDSDQRYTEISIFLSLFIFAAVYQVLLTMIGLRTKNMLLLTMLCCFYGCMLIYTGIQYQEMSSTILDSLPQQWKSPTKGVNIAVIAVLAATMLIQIYMIFRVLRKNVKWFRYKKIGADLRIKRLYTIFQFHRSLLIFDLFFFLGFTVQFIVIMVSNKTSVEFILTVCVLPMTIILLATADFAICRELVALTVLVIAVFFAGCAYILFKIIRLYTKYTSAYNIGVVPGAYFPGRKSLITFGIITLIMLLGTIVIEFILMLRFNTGLLPLVSTYYSWIHYKRGSDKHQMNNAFVDNEKRDSEDDDDALSIN